MFFQKLFAYHQFLLLEICYYSSAFRVLINLLPFPPTSHNTTFYLYLFSTSEKQHTVQHLCSFAHAFSSPVSTFYLFLLIQFSAVAQLCPTLCDPMNRSTPGLPVHHQLPEFTQTHAHRVGDTILDSVYMYQYTIFVFLFHFTLYNRLQVHPPHQN